MNTMKHTHWLLHTYSYLHIHINYIYMHLYMYVHTYILHIHTHTLIYITYMHSIDPLCHHMAFGYEKVTIL